MKKKAEMIAVKKVVGVLGLAVSLLCSLSWADTDAWFAGGSYDGYDRYDVQQAVTAVRGTLFILR